VSEKLSTGTERKELTMARFVRLVKLTPAGMMNIKELPERFAKGRQYLESLGGKIVDIYAVSGPLTSSPSSRRPTRRR
jgi:uncharacterized protein with GYD domain